MEDNELLKAAIADKDFNEYDKAAIAKEMMLAKAFVIKDVGATFLAQSLSFLAATAIVFMPLTELEKAFLTIIASPSAAVTLFKSGRLEQFVTTSRRKIK